MFAGEAESHTNIRPGGLSQNVFMAVLQNRTHTLILRVLNPENPDPNPSTFFCDRGPQIKNSATKVFEIVSVCNIFSPSTLYALQTILRDPLEEPCMLYCGYCDIAADAPGTRYCCAYCIGGTSAAADVPGMRYCCGDWGIKKHRGFITTSLRQEKRTAPAGQKDY